MLKQEIKLELKQVLEQILKLLQQLRLEMKLDLKMVQNLASAIQQSDPNDLRDLSHEVIRRGGIENARAMHKALHFMLYQQCDDTPLRDFTEILGYRVRAEDARRRATSSSGTMIAFRLILREPPPFFGGMDGTEENIVALLNRFGQSNPLGKPVWVLGGGWAVEMLTGRHLRDHHDIDTVLLYPKRPILLDTDRVHTDDYFGSLSCTTQFFRQHCVRSVEWSNKCLTVMVVAPEFLFLSKFLRKPRTKDWDDARALIETFAETWNLDLIGKLIDRNNCGFERKAELINILRSRDKNQIITSLESLWS